MRQKIIDSDLLFSKLMENSQAGIALLDPNFNIIYRSSSVRLINGSKDEMRSKHLMDLVHPSDRQMLHIFLNEILAEENLSKTCTFRALHADGHYIWLECVCTNMLHEPLIEAIALNFIDITHKKQVEESLHQTINELYAYKYALDQSAIIAITDQKGIIQHVNDNFCQISKYTAEELLGQDHRIINSDYHDKAFIKNLWHTIANGKTWRGEIKNKAKDGSFYWVDTTIVPFLNEQGKPYQYLAIRSDITERKLSEERLMALNQDLQNHARELSVSERRYSELFHLSPLPMWVFDLNTLMFLDVNLAAINHYGYSKEEFLSMNIKQIRPVGEEEKVDIALSAAKHKGEFYAHDYFKHQKKNGEIISVDIQNTAIEYKGMPAQLILAIDVTERLNYTRAIEEQNKKLTEISWIQSHVIRAPLAKIMGLIPLILEMKDNDEEKEKLLRFLKLSADELDDVIKNITSITKLSSE
ncbi:PAS domain S-box protein [Mucilaginibacter jinjuensis]|uniref:histidine kinase n=1 Tax=Mucilaginibacter jinjuensis TaxID=1176721 RepID=A0ABY7T618_9SPHI|nr:PAS domain S-box protein [Mucilaginibacter jinjuensis]WCT11924.1 PAS domain S-box protein [Mucilaginibacter jinjuensis]